MLSTGIVESSLLWGSLVLANNFEDLKLNTLTECLLLFSIRMLCGQPVFVILKSRKSYFRYNSVLSSDYYRYEIFDFKTMINPILEMAILNSEL